MSGNQKYQEIPAVELNVLKPPEDVNDAGGSVGDDKDHISALDWKSKTSKRSKKSKREKQVVTDAQLASYKELFKTFDKDNNQCIDLNELDEMLESCGMRMGIDDLREILEEFDEDNNGTIDFDEFLQIFVQLV